MTHLIEACCRLGNLHSQKMIRPEPRINFEQMTEATSDQPGPDQEYQSYCNFRGHQALLTSSLRQ